MNSFTFHCPTEVVFGKDAELKTAEYVKKYGGHRVLLVYGGSSAEKSGLLGRIRLQLEGSGLPFSEFGGVKPNPVLSHAREGIALALRTHADFILAVGGGSVIDTAKCIAHGAANPVCDVWTFWTKENTVTKSLPVGAVLTIPAAGSETSDSSVITNDQTGSKRGLSTDFNRPKFAVLNPRLAATLPRYQVACGVVDIMMHTMERFFGYVPGAADNPTENEITDEIAASLLRVVIKNGPAALKDPADVAAMSELMWCGSLSHNGLTGLGSPKDFATHQLGHELSGMFDVAHGASLSAVWGSWARYCCPAAPSRFARFGEMVWGMPKTENPEQAASAAIDKTVSFFKSLGMPANFTELGIGVKPEPVLAELSDRCAFYGKRKIGKFKVLGRDDIYKIYSDANR